MSTMDKVKNALNLNKNDNTTTTAAGTTGVTGTTSTTHPHHTHNTVPEGTSGYTGTGVTGTSGTTTAGPHSSNLMNKLDPTVDSRTGYSTTGHSGVVGTGNTGYAGTDAGLTGTSTTGHHHGHHGHHGHHATAGTAGNISNSTNAGPHDSNLANKLDPRVDSDLDGRGNRAGAHTGGLMGASGSHATPGSGTAQNTAGPHNSDLLNKLDPRVDADLDGSKTIGGNATYR